MIKRTRERGDLIFETIVYFILSLVTLTMVLPFVNIMAMAFSDGWAVTSGKVTLWPIGFQVDTLLYVISTQQFITSFLISTLVMALGTSASLLMTSLAAYPLSKKHLPGMRLMIMLFVFTMLFSGGMIPTYMLIRSLGLINKLGSLFLPLMINVFNMLVVKNYFESLPESMEESARMDGANNLIVLFRIVLPVASPVLATIGLFYAVGYWNDFLSPMLYISIPKLRPLQLYLREVIMEMGSPNAGADLEYISGLSPGGIRAALIVGSTLPIALIFPFLQKYFTKGAMVGSIKG